MVREYEQLKDIIIPFFYKKLNGHKGEQFQKWLDQMGNDPEVSTKFKNLYKIYKSGFYDNPPCKWFWEEKEEKEFKENVDRVVANEIAIKTKFNNPALYFLQKKE